MQPLKTYTLHISVFAILLQNTEPRFPHKKHLENHPGFDLKAEKDDEAFRDQRKVYVCLHLLCIISTFCLILPFGSFRGGGEMAVLGLPCCWDFPLVAGVGTTL